MFKGIVLSQVFFNNVADAVAVGSDCPNENWQPALDFVTGQVQLVDGETVCEPKSDAFKISCSPTGIKVEVDYGLLYDTYDPETIAASLAADPPRFGKCRGQPNSQPDESESEFDYEFSFDYDQTNEDGEFCFTDVLSGQTVEGDDQSYINFIYEITGSDSAIKNEFGMILSSVLSFQAYCALPESLELTNGHSVTIPSGEHQGFNGAVDHGALASQFVLNKYSEDWSSIENESVAEIGAPTNFKVDAAPSFPSVINYFITECRLDGLNDNDDDMSYVINNNVDCFSTIVDAEHRNPQELTFNMFAYGHSDLALASNVLNCQVQLCVGSQCFQQYYDNKPTCDQGYAQGQSFEPANTYEASGSEE